MCLSLFVRQLGDPSYLSWNRNSAGHWAEKQVVAWSYQDCKACVYFILQTTVAVVWFCTSVLLIHMLITVQTLGVSTPQPHKKGVSIPTPLSKKIHFFLFFGLLPKNWNILYFLTNSVMCYFRQLGKHISVGYTFGLLLLNINSRNGI